MKAVQAAREVISRRIRFDCPCPILIQQGYDCQTTRDADLLGASDEDQLRYATKESRAIFTYDIKDFLRLSEDWMQTGRLHAGIILSRQARLPELTRRFQAFLRFPHDLHNQV
ncbi:MAG: DUF5615 family PIN-like protein [Nitrospirales bacterium]